MGVALLLSVFVALAAPWIARCRFGRGAWLLVLVPLVLFCYYGSLVPEVAGGAALFAVYEWAPALGVELALRCDGLSLIFALLISALGTLVVAYSIPYMRGQAHRGRFFAYLLLFMSAMLGVVFADDLLTLYVFWELTTITSYLLIGFENQRETARNAARQGLLVTSACSLIMLAGFVMLSTAAGGSFRISDIVARADAVRAHALYTPALVTIAIGAFAKSAQFPLHFWLPNAMAAPTPVSAYLHSATMVKAGVYLLARLSPVLGGTALWFALLTGAGVLTMLIGALLALRNTDLKRVLAYSTVTVLGMLVFLLGAGTEAGAVAAMVLLLAHALYKGALFLVVGGVDHKTGGRRDVLELGGLFRSMPISAATAAVAAASMAGLPPFFGFAFKELTYTASLELGTAPVLLTAAAVLANALTVVAAGVVVVRTFLGRGRAIRVSDVHEAPPAMWLPPVLLAVAGLVLSVFPAFMTGSVIEPAVAAIVGRPVAAEVSTLPHWNLEFLLSAITLAAGVLGYVYWDRLRACLARVDRGPAFGPERVYHGVYALVQRVAKLQTRAILHGHLRYDLLTLVATYLLLAGGAMVAGSVPDLLPRSLPPVAAYEWVLLGLAVASALAAIFMRTRLRIVVALAVLGFVIALFYLMLGAIDLAMTQFLVETLIIVILLLVLRRLPPLEPLGRVRLRVHGLDLALSLAFGALVTALLIGVTRHPMDHLVSDYYSHASVPEGHGHNVVNVILVDFRALDTLGEVLVIATAALGGWALLKARASTRPEARP